MNVSSSSNSSKDNCKLIFIWIDLWDFLPSLLFFSPFSVSCLSAPLKRRKSQIMSICIFRAKCYKQLRSFSMPILPYYGTISTVKKSLKIIDIWARVFHREDCSPGIYEFTIPIDYGCLAVATGKTDVYNIEL